MCKHDEEQVYATHGVISSFSAYLAYLIILFNQSSKWLTSALINLYTIYFNLSNFILSQLDLWPSFLYS